MPALGCSEQQRTELESTIRRSQPDVVVDGSPANLQNWLTRELPVVNVRYQFVQRTNRALKETVIQVLRDFVAGRPLPSTTRSDSAPDAQ